MAESLALLDPRTFPLPFDDSLLAALDNGVHPDGPAGLVENYAYDWWNSTTTVGCSSMLSHDTPQAALDLHWKQNKSTPEPPIPATPMPKSAESALGCPKCSEYREIASGAVAELEGLHRFAEAAETSAQATWEEDMRRAPGLYILNQAIQEKEFNVADSAPPTTPIPQAGPSTIDGVRINRNSKRVLNKATAELHRLQQLPPGSHKWTWGEELSAAEVRQLIPTARPNLKHHSGYVLSLPEGRCRKYFSPDPSHPSTTSAVYSPVADDTMNIPPLSDTDDSIDKLGIVDDEQSTRRQHFADLSNARVADADRTNIELTVVADVPIPTEPHVSPEVIAEHSTTICTNAGLDAELLANPGVNADGHADDAGIDADVEDTDTDGDRLDEGVPNADLAGLVWGSDDDAVSDVGSSEPATTGEEFVADNGDPDFTDADQAGAAWGSGSNADTDADADADADGASSDGGPNANDAENAWDMDGDDHSTSSVPPPQ